MEKPTFIAIDYNSQENRVIEEIVRDYYQLVKNTLEVVLYGRIKIPNSPRGLCADLIEVSRTVNSQFDYSDPIFLWRQVIKPWFTPQRFHLTEVYFSYGNPIIIRFGEGIEIESKVWYKVSLESLKNYEYLLGTAFWFPISKNYNAERLKILECALEDLERIKKEGEPKLPPITFEEPKIYP